MSNTRTPQSIFPDYPHTQMMVQKDGSPTSAWALSLQSLYQALQKNFKNEGIVFPPLTADQTATIQALYTPFIGQPYTTMLQSLPDISGQTIFNSTIRLPQQFIITFAGSPLLVTAASWKTFTLT